MMALYDKSYEIEIPDGALDASITLGYFTAIHTSDFILKWIHTLREPQIIKHLQL